MTKDLGCFQPHSLVTPETLGVSRRRHNIDHERSGEERRWKSMQSTRGTCRRRSESVSHLVQAAGVCLFPIGSDTMFHLAYQPPPRLLRTKAVLISARNGYFCHILYYVSACPAFLCDMKDRIWVMNWMINLTLCKTWQLFLKSMDEHLTPPAHPDKRS